MRLVALRSTSFTMCIGPATVISMPYGIFFLNIVSQNASILPSFQYFNALICNILIFGIIFDYDFLQFSINLWPESVTKRSQNRPIRLYSNIWNLWASGGSVPPGALPLDPTRGSMAGLWTPRQFTLHSLRSNVFSTPTKKKSSAGPVDH